MIRVVLFLCTWILSVTTLHRPNYLVPCSKSHNFSACAIDHAKKAIPYLLNGDRRLGLPSMNPLEITLVDLQGVENMHLVARNIKVYGLDELELLNVDIDFDKNEANTLCTVPRLVILGEYTMSGKLLFFPLNGHGPMNITLSNGIYKYNFDWNLQKINGEEYAKLANSSFDYKLQKVHYDFQNLFNGNEVFGKRINEVLNDNWEIVNEDLKPSVLETLLLIYNRIFGEIYSKIPFRELFLE